MKYFLQKEKRKKEKKEYNCLNKKYSLRLDLINTTFLTIFFHYIY